MILDGEIVALGARRPAVVQRAAESRAAQDARRRSPTRNARRQSCSCASTCCISRASICAARRTSIGAATSSQCLLPSTHIQLVHASDDAEKLYAASLASGFEGIVAKRKDSPYQPGKRPPAWLKIKATQTAEFVVGGYTQGKGAREPLGALLLGYWAGNKLQYVGHVGSASTDTRRRGPARALREAHAQGPTVRREAAAASTDDLARAEARRRSDLRRLDTGRHAARSGVPSRCATDIAADSIRDGPEGEARKPPREPSPTPANEIDAVLEQLEGTRSSSTLAVGDAKHPAHESRSGVLARRSAQRAAGRSPSATSFAISRRCRLTCCRTCRIGRSR